MCCVPTQLMEYKASRTSDSMSSGSMSASVASSIGQVESPATGGATVKFPYENDYDYHVRMRRMSRSSKGSISRNISMDSSCSSMSSNASPTDPYTLYKPAIQAEQVLANLGFCAADSFLPERFAKDWYNKMVQSKQDRFQNYQQMSRGDMIGSEPNSRTPSGSSTPHRHSISLGESFKRFGGKASIFRRPY